MALVIQHSAAQHCAASGNLGCNAPPPASGPLSGMQGLPEPCLATLGAMHRPLPPAHCPGCRGYQHLVWQPGVHCTAPCLRPIGRDAGATSTLSGNRGCIAPPPASGPLSGMQGLPAPCLATLGALHRPLHPAHCPGCRAATSALSGNLGCIAPPPASGPLSGMQGCYQRLVWQPWVHCTAPCTRPTVRDAGATSTLSGNLGCIAPPPASGPLSGMQGCYQRLVWQPWVHCTAPCIRPTVRDAGLLPAPCLATLGALHRPLHPAHCPDAGLLPHEQGLQGRSTARHQGCQRPNRRSALAGARVRCTPAGRCKHARRAGRTARRRARNRKTRPWGRGPSPSRRAAHQPAAQAQVHTACSAGR